MFVGARPEAMLPTVNPLALVVVRFPVLKVQFRLRDELAPFAIVLKICQVFNE
jgi:hypothetical protein